jgi:hypothetical protein
MPLEIGAPLSISHLRMAARAGFARSPLQDLPEPVLYCSQIRIADGNALIIR